MRKDGTLVSEYQYDSLGQLVCEEYPVEGDAYVYSYDKAGNITAKYHFPYSEGAFNTDYLNYLSAHKTTIGSYAYGNTSWGDILTSYNNSAINYDAIGNPTNWRNTFSMSWDVEIYGGYCENR